MPDDPQPDTGQGTTGEAGLFDPYLQTVPEEHRQVVGSYLADAAKNVNSRLEEAAALRNTLGPYQTVEHLTQYDPESLGQLLQWHQQVTSSDEAFKTWLDSASKDAGLSPADVQELDESDLSRDQIAKMVSDLAQERVGPLQDRVEKWEFDQAVATENKLIDDSFAKLEQSAGSKFTDEQRRVIMDLGNSATTPEQTLTAGHDWVADGYKRFQEIVGQGNKTFIDQKLDQPKMPLSSGGTAAVDAPKTWADADASARERLRISRST